MIGSFPRFLCFVITFTLLLLPLQLISHSPLSLSILGLIPYHRLSRFLKEFLNSSGPSFFSVCRTLIQLGVHLSQQSTQIFTCNPCPVDRLRHLSISFKDHCRLVAGPSSRCHRCRDLFFNRKIWSARDECANELIRRERERRDGG